MNIWIMPAFFIAVLAVGWIVRILTGDTYSRLLEKVSVVLMVALVVWIAFVRLTGSIE